jgi:ribosomal protein L9
MKVILLSDVKKVGKKGELVEVADGYGRNYLIRNKLAVLATEKSVEILQDQKAQNKAHEKEVEKDAEQLKKRLETITLVFDMKTGKEGKVFGSVSTKQIAEELEKKHQIKVDKRKFVDNEPLTNLGLNAVRIELHKSVIGVVQVHLLAKE